MSIELDKQILDAVRKKPGQKAKEIAITFGVERNIVNSALYRLKSKLKQDRTYRWFPRGDTEEDSQDQTHKKANTVLANLCRYYLDCLSHDDLGGVSEFATDKYDDPKYVELGVLPMFDEDENDPFATDEGGKLLGRVRRDRNKQIIYLGYPVRLNLIRSKKGWEGLFVEPILLFAFEDADSSYSRLTLADELPQINFRALRALSNAGDSNLMEEVIQIVDELGLANIEDDQPEIDDLLARLRVRIGIGKRIWILTN
ncbi:MAG TPA: hypothetical protein EYO73_11870 [Sulfurimonas sp.]|nr:hypothetical protein [Sulfurimonas sp.]